MRRQHPMVWLAAVSIVATACGQSGSNAEQSGQSVAQAGGPAKTDKSADEAALRAMYQKLAGELSAGDTAAIGARFLDDGVEITPGMPPTSGREAVKKEFVSVFGSMKNLKVNMGSDATVTVADAGDLAVVRAPYRLTYTGPKGKQLEDHGTSLTVFKKVNGHWKVLIDSNVSEVPPSQ